MPDVAPTYGSGAAAAAAANTAAAIGVYGQRPAAAGGYYTGANVSNVPSQIYGGAGGYGTNSYGALSQQPQSAYSTGYDMAGYGSAAHTAAPAAASSAYYQQTAAGYNQGI